MMMNAEIEEIFKGFKVDSVKIPLAYMFYEGKASSYIVYSCVDMDNSYSGDDKLLGYVTYYDFEINSNGNYFEIVRAVINLMEENGWQFEPSLSSADQYNRDTKTYSKTLCFAKHIQTT